MPNKICDHGANREKVCAPCGSKINQGNSKIERFIINDNKELLIKKFLNRSFNKSDERYPCSICITCKLTLEEHEKGIEKRQLPKMKNYEDIVLRRNTRSTDQEENLDCNCYICITARSKGHKESKRGRGQKRRLEQEIKRSDGLSYASTGTPDLKKKKLNEVSKKKKETITLCKKCYHEIRRGKSHPCCTKDHNQVNGIMELVNSLPEEKQQKLLSLMIKKQAEKQGNDAKKNQLTLKNIRGKNTTLEINPAEKKVVSFTIENLCNFQNNMSFSSREMKKVTQLVRSTFGRKSVPAYTDQQLSDRGKILNDFYDVGFYDFDTSHTGKERRPVVYADAEKLVEEVVNQRKIEGYYTVKVMADGGQNFFKVSFSILENDDEDDSEYEDFESMSSEKTTLGDKAKSTSVLRVILICIIPDIKETYDNLKILFDLVNLNRISFKFAADFKLLLIINGQQTATATYPCPYCFITLDDLKETEIDYEPSVRLKSYGDLRSDFDKFCEFNKNKKFAKECGSTVNPPLFDEEDERLVIEKCVIPELHIMQGFVNHIFWTRLMPFTDDRALLWPERLNLVPSNYQGRVFEGNACRKLLQNPDVLFDPEIAGNNPLRMVPFVSAFKVMDKIVHEGFSNRKSCDVDELLSHLQTIFPGLYVSKSLKLHVLLDHLKDGLYLRLFLILDMT